MISSNNKFILDWKQNFFQGFCRDQDSKFDMIAYIDTDSLDECKKQCLNTSSCSAFSSAVYQDHAANDCVLYRGGPYTKASYSPYWKCYVLENSKN